MKKIHGFKIRTDAYHKYNMVDLIRGYRHSKSTDAKTMFTALYVQQLLKEQEPKVNFKKINANVKIC